MNHSLLDSAEAAAGAKTPSEATLLLRELRAGDSSARNRVIGLVYSDLRRVAVRLLGRERRDALLSPSTLVHETVIRLLSDPVLAASANRRGLLAASARIMRQVLVDHARRRGASRRGGKWTRVSLEEIAEHADPRGVDVVALHDLLEQLARFSERIRSVVELRFFSGLTVPEVAESLGVSIVTVERDWRLARDWLRSRLGGRNGA